MLIEIVNFISLISSLIFFAIFYSLSLIPVKRSEKYGDAAWKQCGIFRLIASIFELISVINIILWIFYPIQSLDFKIFPEFWKSIALGIILLIPFGFILFKAMIDAGKETMQPSKDTKLYSGIYKYIRHPQTLGEFPMWAIFGLMTNSWIIFLIGLTFIIIYTPIMIKIEEADLIRRFGEIYIEYKKNTGCLFPKLQTLKNLRKTHKK
ncbi:MAG: methyltransferase family protein [Candidatus Helarchaeota archaeon]